MFINKTSALALRIFLFILSMVVLPYFTDAFDFFQFILEIINFVIENWGDLRKFFTKSKPDQKN
jgi:hypothetical protein